MAGINGGQEGRICESCGLVLPSRIALEGHRITCIKPQSASFSHIWNPGRNSKLNVNNGNPTPASEENVKKFCPCPKNYHHFPNLVMFVDVGGGSKKLEVWPDTEPAAKVTLKIRKSKQIYQIRCWWLQLQRSQYK